MIDNELYFETFSDERDLELIIKLVEQDLSEPYSIYTYRFFIYECPKMCIMVRSGRWWWLRPSYLSDSFFSARRGTLVKLWA